MVNKRETGVSQSAAEFNAAPGGGTSPMVIKLLTAIGGRCHRQADAAVNVDGRGLAICGGCNVDCRIFCLPVFLAFPKWDGG